MARLEESELILNDDGSIYHLRLRPEHLADNIIVVGDPQRVEIISRHFDSVEFRIQNREIITHTGYYNHKRLTVLSTGMGTDNIDIVINELDALVNIDLQSREIKKELKSLNIIRLGTSGAIQPEIPLNAFVMSEYGIGLDGLMHFYNTDHPLFNHPMNEAFIAQTHWPSNLPSPYAVSGSDYLKQKLGDGFICGITATAPGFYGPQGRKLRLDLGLHDLNQRLETFSFDGLKISNFEMETSALYGLSALLGHNALTICVAIANRHKKEYNKDYKKFMEQLILIALERLTS
ncbi:MAG: nucleoside phosphorylase [Bacteroidales bacterium]|nr:nucleoside phosphorylase [Bacteroidales bacterium]MDZ4204817.1 nucleoside phosphorylase [Bacteroidales bacterium]